MQTPGRTFSKRFALMTIAVVASFAFVARTEAQQAVTYVPWTPTIVNWFCSARATGNACTLFAYGEQLSPGTGSLQGYAPYKVLKGRTAGAGLAIATGIAVINCDRIAPTHLQCTATDQVVLAPGIIPLTASTGGAATLNIYSSTPGPLFDWDGDGRISADKEGLLLLRFLMGFSGSALTQGVPLAAGKTPETVYAAIAAGVINGWFDFVAPGQVPSAVREGAMFERCLLGLRGTALTAGVRNVDATAATTRCNALVAIE